MMRCSVQGLNGWTPETPRLEAEGVGQRQRGEAPLGEVARGVGEGGVAAGAELDLARDQLAGEAFAQGLGRRRHHVLEAVGQREGRGIEELVLLLDADGEVGQRVESFAGPGQDSGKGVAIIHP